MTLCPPHSRLTDNPVMAGMCEGCLFARIVILEENLDRIGSIADKCESLLGAAALGGPRMKAGLEQIRDEAEEVYMILGGANIEDGRDASEEEMRDPGNHQQPCDCGACIDAEADAKREHERARSASRLG